MAPQAIALSSHAFFWQKGPTRQLNKYEAFINHNSLILSGYAPRFLPHLGCKDLVSIAGLTKRDRKFVLTELFNRVDDGAPIYQRKLLEFSLQQGNIDLSSKTIAQLFIERCKDPNLAHNVAQLSGNLSGQKLLPLQNCDDFIFCNLTLNIQNGFRLFNPKEKGFKRLCSLTPMSDLSRWIVTDVNRICYEIIQLAKEFWSKGDKSTNEELDAFIKKLDNLRGKTIEDKALINIALATLITSLRSVDSEQKNIPFLRKVIFHTLLSFAEQLPPPHVFGLFEILFNNETLCSEHILCTLAKYVPETDRTCLMDQLIDRLVECQKNLKNVSIFPLVIGELSDWLTESQIVFTLSCLDLISLDSDISRAYGKVAAHAQDRETILCRFIEKWKSSLDKKVRKNILMIIGNMAKGISIQRNIEVVAFIYENCTPEDLLTGLDLLVIHLKKALEEKPDEKQIDQLHQLFLRGMENSQNANLRCASLNAHHHFLHLLSESQRRGLLQALIVHLNKEEVSASINCLFEDLLRVFKTERMAALTSALEIPEINYYSCLLKYWHVRDMSSPFSRLQFGWNSTEKFNWLKVIERSSHGIARVLTAELLSLPRTNFCHWSHPIVSTKNFDEAQLKELILAIITCLQDKDPHVQEAGISILEQLVKEGRNLSVYMSDLLKPLLGCLFAHYPAYITERGSVLILICPLIPHFAEVDFNLVVATLMTLKEKGIVHKEALVQTIGAIIIALYKIERRHVDNLLQLLFHALKDSRNDSSVIGGWVVKSQVLSVMTDWQLEWWVKELHDLIEMDFSTNALCAHSILKEIASIDGKMQKVIDKYFSKELLSDLRRHAESFKRSTAIFSALAFLPSSEEKKEELRDLFHQEAGITSSIEKKYKAEVLQSAD